MSRTLTTCKSLLEVGPFSSYPNPLGVDQLVSRLKSNIDRGLVPTDLESRVAHFGTNRKEPPERTPYWEFFKKAIDDFMLKLLLVCACVDIGFEEGFNDGTSRGTGKYHPLLLTFLPYPSF